jgi:hypothetical protein
MQSIDGGVKQTAKDRGTRVATFGSQHTAVVNADGTIDIYRAPADGRTTDNEQQKACAAFQNINSRNAEFWASRKGVPNE